MTNPIQGQIVQLSNYGGTVADPTGGFRDDTGTLIDPATVTLTVEYADCTTETFTGDQLAHDGTGLYRIDLDTTNHPGRWLFTWSSTGPQTYQPDSLRVDPRPPAPCNDPPAPLATVSQLAAWLKTTPDQIDTERAQMMLAAASDSIRQATNQTLSLVTDDQVTVDPSGGRFLWLDQLPVVSVSSVVVDGTVLDPTAYRVDRDLGRLWRADHRPWWGRPGSIIVTYTHGYAVLPGDLVGVCLGMAVRGYNADPGDESLIGETIGGDYSYQRSWQVAVAGVAGLTTSDAAVLRNYEVDPQRPVAAGW